MSERFLGDPVINWTPPIEPPSNLSLTGKHVCLKPLTASHAQDLFEANTLDTEGRIWDYLPYGPFDSITDYSAWVSEVSSESDPLFFALETLNDSKVVGVASYLRIQPNNGSIEVGHINYSPLLQNTIAATESMYLMMKWAFENGYRRYEWKCNALNLRSRRAAQRLGFSFEGVFRQAMVIHGKNRDTAWFSVIDKDWDALKALYETWLDEKNFDESGSQIKSLSDLTQGLLANIDPAFQNKN